MIACGSYPNLPDWDEKLLSTLRAGNCLHLIDYIALHNYLGQGKSDLDFTGDEYYALLASVEVTEKALVRACGFAQAFSSFGHRIGVILDEWGTWWKEATVPSGLYQQNTLQDALFTAWNFHLFHRLSEWLYMTNIAQTINVLQALILTKGPELIVTPTYHVYDLFKPHRDADLISCVAECPTIALPDGKQLKGMSFSATCSADGRETCVSVVNYDLTKSYSVNFSFPGSDGWQVAEIKRLTSTDIHDHNTFEHPEKVKVVVVEDGALSPLPPMSITTVRWSKS
jgi:alpha-N-arabinofuranosidase